MFSWPCSEHLVRSDSHRAIQITSGHWKTGLENFGGPRAERSPDAHFYLHSCCLAFELHHLGEEVSDNCPRCSPLKHLMRDWFIRGELPTL